MSKEFTTFNFETNENKNAAMVKGDLCLMSHKENVNTVNDGMTQDMLIGIPSIGQGNYQKTGIECTINLLHQFVHSASKSVTNKTYLQPPNKQMSEAEIPVELLNQLNEIADKLQYMINCTSWRGEEYYSFDKVELGSRFI